MECLDAYKCARVRDLVRLKLHVVVSHRAEEEGGDEFSCMSRYIIRARVEDGDVSKL